MLTVLSPLIIVLSDLGEEAESGFFSSKQYLCPSGGATAHTAQGEPYTRRAQKAPEEETQKLLFLVQGLQVRLQGLHEL